MKCNFMTYPDCGTWDLPHLILQANTFGKYVECNNHESTWPRSAEYMSAGSKIEGLSICAETRCC